MTWAEWLFTAAATGFVVCFALWAIWQALLSGWNKVAPPRDLPPLPTPPARRPRRGRSIHRAVR